MNNENPKKIFEQAEDKFYNMPTSPASDLIMQTLGTSGDIKQLETGAKAVRTATQFTFKQAGEHRLIEAQKGSSTILIELTDIEKIMGSRKGVKKMFLYALMGINEQAFSIDASTGQGVLRDIEVNFSLHDLVEAGLYKSLDTARRGFKEAALALTSIKVSGQQVTNKGKKKTTSIEALEVLFTGSNIKNGICTLYLNGRINWTFICRFYTIIPKYAFKLGVSPFTLLYFICYLARQNTDKIREQGYFNISLERVRSRLGLPEVKGNTNPKKTIRDVIEYAIEEIERLNYEYKVTGFTITPVYNENGNIKDYLEKGYLKIAFDKEFAQYFIDIALDRAKLIEQDQKKKDKIETTAKAKALQKAIEAEQEANKKES